MFGFCEGVECEWKGFLVGNVWRLVQTHVFSCAWDVLMVGCSAGPGCISLGDSVFFGG